MFAKGPMPGYSRKEEALKFHPGAYCVKETAASLNITGYVVYDAQGRALASGGSAASAWEKAISVKPKDSK